MRGDIHEFDKDQTSCITRHFFFMRDMAKSKPSIFNQMDGTESDLHLSISSDPLIEHEEANQMVMPKLSLYMPKGAFSNISSNQTI